MHENKRRILKKNPLKNRRVMGRLNPYDKVVRKAALELEARRKRQKAGVLDAKRGTGASKKPAKKGAKKAAKTKK